MCRPPGARTPSGESGIATILIVDDVPANRTFLANLLRQHGHRTLEAVNGREGLAAVGTERPDLVITDVLMPVMDGYEFVRHLRLDPATAHIPVLFYTANYGAREARTLAMSVGVAAVLTKPALPATLLEIIGRVLTGAPDRPPPADPAPPAAWSDHEHLRLLTARLAGKADDLRADNARLRALVNIGLDFASDRDPQRRLADVCASVHDLFGATYVTLGILDQQAHTVRRFVTCGLGQAPWIKAGDEVAGPLRTAIAERRTLRGNSADGNPACLTPAAGHPPVHAYLAAPITSSSHAYGWICLVGNDGQTFTEDDEELMLALAGQVGRVYQLEEEVIERRQAETALRQERDRTQNYLDTAEVMLLALDAEARITLVNRHACTVLGRPAGALLGHDWVSTCLPAHLHEAFREGYPDLLAGVRPIAENPVLTGAGDERLIEWHNTVLRDGQGRLCGTLSSGTDVTDRRVLEERYRQAQKMDAIGQLAGGIAHDFNNLLTVVLIYAELLLEDLTAEHPCRTHATEILRAGTSAAALTRQLLTFSRQQVVAPAVTGLNAVVADLHPMLARLIREDVTIVLDLEPALASVLADRNQIEQVILNLSVNARDAMPRGGTLTLRTANVTLDERDTRTHYPLTPGAYVSLTVSDTGIGIPPDALARVFEPFFTTKPPGEGTGLGLATVHGIAVQSGGSVHVDSEPGRGTSFTVYLPRATVNVTPYERTATAATARLGTETVLVVDDAEPLRELVRTLLARRGYTVLTAANAEDALAMAGAHGAIDLLLTDLVMPGTGGPELSRQILARQPALRIAYMSGYAQGDTHQQEMSPGMPFLHKPFTADALERVVRGTLDAPVPSKSPGA
ncbi:MAG: response regulator [Vicinamibacterales bacterium]|nr:response regulator [Vicinamibacterales bacterium]